MTADTSLLIHIIVGVMAANVLTAFLLYGASRGLKIRTNDRADWSTLACMGVPIAIFTVLAIAIA